MGEHVVVRFRYPDGQESSHVVEIEDDGWPLPDTFTDERGGFRKVSESQLPQSVKGVMRGALYEPVVG